MRQILLSLMTAALLLPMPVSAVEDVKPSTEVVANTLNIVGPLEAVKPGADAWLKIDGLTVDEIKQAKKDGLFDLTVFPLTNVRVHASYDWLQDTLELTFRAQSPGEYLVKLHLVRSGKLEIAAAVVAVEGVSPNPQPGPDPKPEPGPLPQGTRLALILWESSAVTVQQANVKEALRKSLAGSNIQFRCLEPDQPSENDWAKPIQEEVARRKVNLPALVVSVLINNTNTDEVFFAGVDPLPASGDAAIAYVKEKLP